MNLTKYQQILKTNVVQSVMPVKRGWLLQQDNDPQLTSKSIMNYFKKHKLLERPTQSTDLNIIENLWEAFKHMLCVQESLKISENLKWFKGERFLQAMSAKSRVVVLKNVDMLQSLLKRLMT